MAYHLAPHQNRGRGSIPRNSRSSHLCSPKSCSCCSGREIWSLGPRRILCSDIRERRRNPTVFNQHMLSVRRNHLRNISHWGSSLSRVSLTPRANQSLQKGCSWQRLKDVCLSEWCCILSHLLRHPHFLSISPIPAMMVKTTWWPC